MENIRLAIIASLLVTSLLANLHSDSIDEFVERSSREDSDDNYLLPLQEEENWLVLRVSFPGKSFPSEKISNLFEGELSAKSYIQQMSGGKSSLSYTLIDSIWESPYEESYWGKDSGDERDVGESSGGASELARMAISHSIKDKKLHSIGDLNEDKKVDRIVILHSGAAQELSAPSSAIWSHFSPFQDSVEIDDYEYEHYTLVSIYSGLGVLVHEMLHQMGAVDLYDVHSETPTRSWNGLGDWCVMSSGNWIEDGSKPSLPSASILNLIGASDSKPIDSSLRQQFVLAPTSDGGQALNINIAPSETIWVSLRSDTGFDSSLPGHGIIVEHQDSNFGDLDSNLVNTDPKKAWSKIIEADNDDSLLRARDYGSPGDAFLEGDRFGSEGLKIWDNRGRLVQWYVEVVNISNGSAIVDFVPVGDDEISVLTPRSPISLIPGESAKVSIIANEGCLLFMNVTSTMQSSDSETFDINQGVNEITLLEIDSQSTNHGMISGSIGCENSPSTQINIEWYRIAHRLSNSTLEATIHWEDRTTVSFHPEYIGNGSRTYAITIDGPAQRISTVTTQGNVNSGEPIFLEVSPSGLMEPGMIARGELILIDSSKLEQRIPIILQAESSFPFSGPIGWLSEPSNAITLTCIFLALSLATARRSD